MIEDEKAQDDPTTELGLVCPILYNQVLRILFILKQHLAILLSIFKDVGFLDQLWSCSFLASSLFPWSVSTTWFTSLRSMLKAYHRQGFSILGGNMQAFFPARYQWKSVDFSFKLFFRCLHFSSGNPFLSLPFCINVWTRKEKWTQCEFHNIFYQHRVSVAGWIIAERALTFTCMEYAVLFGVEYPICNNMLVFVMANGWEYWFENAVKPWIFRESSFNLWLLLRMFNDLKHFFFSFFKLGEPLLLGWLIAA